MADPITGTILVGATGVVATATGVVVSGVVGAATLGYTVYKDRKETKRNKKKALEVVRIESSHNSDCAYQASASYQKSGTEAVFFGPDRGFLAVGNSASDWSCGTITFNAHSEQVVANGLEGKMQNLWPSRAMQSPYK